MVVSDSSMVMPQPGGPGTSNITFYASGVFHRKMYTEVICYYDSLCNRVHLSAVTMHLSAVIIVHLTLSRPQKDKVHACTISLGSIFRKRFIVKV